MGSLVKKISENKDKNAFWSFAYGGLYAAHKFAMRCVPTKALIAYRYKKRFGRPLDLARPKTFNEKILWKQVYGDNKAYARLSDKYAVRKHIAETIGKEYLIPLQYTTTDPRCIPFDTLDYPVIIKSNHASGQKIILKDKSAIDRKAVIRECTRWLNINYYDAFRESQYKDIVPRIVVESLLVNKQGRIPIDYKLHCFNGKVECILAMDGRFETDRKIGFFDTKWKFLPFNYGVEEGGTFLWKHSKSFKKPKNLKKMVALAEKLAKDFDFVRVDLYSVQDKIYFGELTFTPGAGLNKFYPETWDNYFGDKLQLANKK